MSDTTQEATSGLFDTPVNRVEDAPSFLMDAATVDEVMQGPSALVPGGPSVHHHEAPKGVLGEMLAYSRDAPPRDMNHIMRAARRMGELLADEAYYRFPVGGQTVEGPTIQLMEALQGVYGHLTVRISIDKTEMMERGERVHFTVEVADLLGPNLRQNPDSHVLAPPPGKFANNLEQAERWRSMQLRSVISKAVRGCLEDVIPRPVVKAAMTAAKNVEAALAYASKDGRVTREQAVEGALAWGKSKGLSQDDLEWKTGAEVALWTASDILLLRRIAERVRDGQTTVEAEWAAYRDQPAEEPASSGAKGGLSAAKKKGSKAQGEE